MVKNYVIFGKKVQKRKKCKQQKAQNLLSGRFRAYFNEWFFTFL